MRRMRRQTWSEFGDVHLHWEASMRVAVENSAALVCSVVPNGQIIKGIGLGRECRSLRGCDACRSYQSW